MVNPLQEIKEMRWELKEISIHKMENIIEQLSILKDVLPEYHELSKSEKKTINESFTIIIETLKKIIT